MGNPVILESPMVSQCTVMGFPEVKSIVYFHYLATAYSTAEARSVAQTPAAPGRRSVHCHMPAADSLQGALRRRKAITLADCLANHARKMAQLTEGMRVFFAEGGPTYLCVGRDEQ